MLPGMKQTAIRIRMYVFDESPPARDTSTSSVDPSLSEAFRARCTEYSLRAEITELQSLHPRDTRHIRSGVDTRPGVHPLLWAIDEGRRAGTV